MALHMIVLMWGLSNVMRGAEKYMGIVDIKAMKSRSGEGRGELSKK